MKAYTGRTDTVYQGSGNTHAFEEEPAEWKSLSTAGTSTYQIHPETEKFLICLFLSVHDIAVCGEAEA